MEQLYGETQIFRHDGTLELRSGLGRGPKLLMLAFFLGLALLSTSSPWARTDAFRVFVCLAAACGLALTGLRRTATLEHAAAALAVRTGFFTLGRTARTPLDGKARLELQASPSRTRVYLVTPAGDRHLLAVAADSTRLAELVAILDDALAPAQG